MSKLELHPLLPYTKSHAQSDGTALGQVAIFRGGRSPHRRCRFHRFSKQTAYGCLANVVRDFLRGLHRALRARNDMNFDAGESCKPLEQCFRRRSKIWSGQIVVPVMFTIVGA